MLTTAEKGRGGASRVKGEVPMRARLERLHAQLAKAWTAHARYLNFRARTHAQEARAAAVLDALSRAMTEVSVAIEVLRTSDEVPSPRHRVRKRPPTARLLGLRIETPQIASLEE